MKMRVIYTDGTTAEAVLGARAQVEVERRYDVLFTAIFDESKGTARVERFYYAAWAALRYPGPGQDPVEEEFDDWLARVADAEPLAEGGAGKGRTRKGQSRTAS